MDDYRTIVKMFLNLHNKLNHIENTLEKIMTTQTEAAQELQNLIAAQNGMTAALTEASTELQATIAGLQATIDTLSVNASQQPITPELQAALDAAIAQSQALAVQAQALADIIPNPPVV